MITRMTNLTFEQLVEILQGKGLSACKGNAEIKSDTLPAGACLNEIGAIFVNDGNKKAEGYLAALFEEDESYGVKCLGYFYLSQKRPELELETLKLIIEFENDPTNAETIDSIKTLIKANSGR